MSERNTDTFVERILGELNAGMSCMSLYIGCRLGLFKALADSKPITIESLSKKTGFNERYMREWLECMAVNEYLDYDEESGCFSLPPEHVPVLVDGDSPYYIAADFGFVSNLSSVIKPLTDAFRSGGGVPFEAYGEDLPEAIGLSTRPLFINDYVDKWIPTMPDIEKRLESGAIVADIGCGTGWSSITLAKAFPKIQIDAVDIDEKSIELARANVNNAGLDGQIKFHHSAAEDAKLKGPYDLVTSFICVHDMAYPVKVLSKLRKVMAPDGAVLIGDVAASDSLSGNCNLIGRYFYNASVLHCLPQSMVFPNSAATGATMGPEKLRKYVSDAGFSKVDILPIENPFWRFYRLTP
ncbi:MAG: class I SAM-dependent methyltransferase [Candidatus Poribacteria bacterium]